jgi:hypothetical protein
MLKLKAIQLDHGSIVKKEKKSVADETIHEGRGETNIYLALLARCELGDVVSIPTMAALLRPSVCTERTGAASRELLLAVTLDRP